MPRAEALFQLPSASPGAEAASPRGLIGPEPAGRPGAGRIIAVSPDRAEERATAERVLAGPLRLRIELNGPQARRASGRIGGELWQDECWYLRSPAARVFRDPRSVRAALDRLAADKRALGELTPARTILIVTAEGTERFRLWTLAPRLTTLRDALDAASIVGAWEIFARALAAWSDALGTALASSLETGHSLDVDPACFATQWGRLRYVDDAVTARRDAPGIEDAFAGRFGEYPAPAAVWEEYTGRVARELARLSRARRSALQLDERLRAAAIDRPAAAPYLARLRAALAAA
jgi:hypothetical protein